MVWDATYKPFGEVDASTGAPINLRFPGQWFSAESDLNQNWMRDYDPTTGRYIQADPLGLVDGASVYGYARQSPNKYTDPRGEQMDYSGYNGGPSHQARNGSGHNPYNPGYTGAEFYIPPPGLSECVKRCMSKANLDSWKHGPQLACAAIGTLGGIASGSGPAVSLPVGTLCTQTLCQIECEECDN